LMETSGYIDELRIVGGHPALDFVNTVDGDPGFDHFRSYSDLLAWSGRIGLLSGEAAAQLAREANRRPAEAEAVHLEALALRGTLHGIFRAAAEGEDPLSRNLETLRGYECEALSRAHLVRVDDRFDWEWKNEGDLSGPLWPVAHVATGLLTSGGLDRLKFCAGCYWLFLDASKNRSRRWCTMEVCGTHEKVRRYVKKRAARRDSQRRA
jgi:predicted RNA-binding Zn ribbon-like protein